MYLGLVEINRDTHDIVFYFESLDGRVNQQIYLNMPPNYTPYVYLTGLWLKHTRKDEYDVDFLYGDTREECYQKIIQLNSKCNLK